MEPSEEVFLIIVAVVIAHFLIFYLLTRKKKSIEGKLLNVAKVDQSSCFLSLKGKHVVVTGGSSGIGLWVAIYAARQGADVTIVARNVKLLGKFQSTPNNLSPAVLISLFTYQL